MRNIVLIGMPGAGKSTIGRALAAMLGFSFVDTDELITRLSGRTLHEIIESKGQAGLRQVEERVLCGLNTDSSVIATGGSAVYSVAGMNHLRRIGQVMYLRCDLSVILERIGDSGKRGIVKRPDQTIGELFEERRILYRHYADCEIDSSLGTADDIALKIVDLLRWGYGSDESAGQYPGPGALSAAACDSR